MQSYAQNLIAFVWIRLE